MYKSAKILPENTIDYKALFYQQKKLKQEFQRRAELAELKLKKLSQTVNKKCIRCMKMEQKESKQQKIMQLRQFKAGLSDKNLKGVSKKATIKTNTPKIQNFAVFGAQESILIDPDEWDQYVDSEVLYISDIPSDTVLHSAGLVFPSGIIPKFYSGPEAKEKSIEIMSSNCGFIKSFIMSFENQQKSQECQLLQLMNPQNRLYAICITVQDFTMVPYLPSKYFESEKTVNDPSQTITKAMQRALSCDDTEATNNPDKQCHIATSERTYCIFSKYPFFHFYEELLKSVISSAKTERLVIYRESGCVTAEADSHFFLERIKIIFKQLSQQIENWQVKINRQLQLKLITCQRLALKLFPDDCKYNFIQEWGLSILKYFTPETFLDVFLLMVLEQKLVFVCENQTILTYTIHLFARLLIQPLKYPYPTVYLLPPKQEYLNSPFPVVYGYCASKSDLEKECIPSRFKNNYVFLKNGGCTEIVGPGYNRNLAKKRPQRLLNYLTKNFKIIQGYQQSRRTSNLVFADNEMVQYTKDKTGVCFDLVRTFNRYMEQQIMGFLPKLWQVKELSEKIEKKGVGKGKEVNQQTYKQILEKYKNKNKDILFNCLLETQIINVYLFP